MVTCFKPIINVITSINPTHILTAVKRHRMKPEVALLLDNRVHLHRNFVISLKVYFEIVWVNLYKYLE
jgi:hypothetical protein